MKTVRLRTVLAIVAVLGIAGTVILSQHRLICSLGESQRSLAEKYQELFDANASLQSSDAAKRAELIRLRQQTSEILSLRSQLARARKQLATAAAGNQTPKTESANEFAGYVTTEQLRFVGFKTPGNALQSMRWAAVNGDYANWLASLAPQFQREELANTNSLKEFERGLAITGSSTGMQVLAAKTVGANRTELKVRLDTEDSVVILVYPMVAIGNEWRLGDDIHTYTEAWNTPTSAQ